jgi:hypothetical protein
MLNPECAEDHDPRLMIRNNDGAADGDGISIIRLTGVVSCVLGGGMSWKVGVAGILIWRDDDLSKAENRASDAGRFQIFGLPALQREVAWGLDEVDARPLKE